MPGTFLRAGLASGDLTRMCARGQNPVAARTLARRSQEEALANTTTDHDTIRSWAEKHGGKPAAVDRTHHDGDVGIIRIMFPKNKQSEHDSLVEISWEEFFQQFDESELALVYEEQSLFSKLVGRDTLEEREHGDNHASRHERRDSHASLGKAHASPKASDHKAGSTRHEAGSAKTSGKHEPAASKASAKHDDSHEAGAGKDQVSDLKAREYRDADGNVHHHTRAYMESHRKG